MGLREVVAVMSIAVLLSFGGCVNTDSSSSANDTADTNQTDPGTDDNTTDDNTTDPGDDNTTEPNDDPTEDDFDSCDPKEDQQNSDFDTRCATLDEDACLQDGVYGQPLSDTFFTNQGESDGEFGVGIRSKVSSSNLDTTVWLYYPIYFGEADALEFADEGTTIATSLYDLSYDLGWVNSTQKTFYVRTPPLEQTNDMMACYRYVIDSSDATEIEGEKVYRLR